MIAREAMVSTYLTQSTIQYVCWFKIFEDVIQFFPKHIRGGGGSAMVFLEKKVSVCKLD